MNIFSLQKAAELNLVIRDHPEFLEEVRTLITKRIAASSKVEADNLDGTDDGTDNTTIGDWNTHVNTVAAGSSLAGIPGLNWFAIVSVDDDATGPNVGVATGFADFWDSSLLVPI